MDRRIFVKLSAFSAAAISLSLLESCHGNIHEKTVASPGILSHLLESETLKDIGEAYLHQTPGEKNKETLIHLLLDNNKIDSSSNEEAIHAILNTRVTKDFESGNTVVVEGWILAITEARQCALFFLIQQ